MDTTTNAPTTHGYTSGTWTVDPDSSTIAFAVRQLFSKARCRFSSYDVTIVTSAAETDSFVTATIDLASVDSGNARRDNHLRKLMKAEDDPTMTYRSTGLHWSDGAWVVDGDLTIHDTTRPVPLAVTANRFTEDALGDRRASISATAQISRREFGIKIPGATGGTVIGDKVAITLEIQAVRQT
ncbi:MAG: YceI family protein [Aeromicrobium sp.]|nr:YceI family protein [Aeromicrobium sp.]